MEVIIRPDAQAAVKLTAKIMADDLIKKPDMVFGLATGRTMEAVYAELANLHRNCGTDFSLAKSFNLDEYIGLPSEDKNSYRYYMNYHLFNNVNIDLRNTHLPNGIAEDLDAEGPRYEQAIVDAGGIDMQLLGIGCDGHIGFNEPLSSLASRTRQKALTPETYEQNSPLFDNPEDMPKRAFTMGVGTILDAKRIVMLVTGAEKADVLAKAVEGPVTSMISASALQLHSRVVVIVDEEAATKLEGKDYYNWIFQNEPEWEPYRSM
ncbi:MAG: glucosamine-6-phosphate deaminase [Lentisphaerae bacterium]|nr:glucosamine-6-phosphate deaminase [Lentisphaerota bacterium]MCP4103459.1 glucosamine-6-phosphate deaminase [Lentisphaerota bacterium]